METQLCKKDFDATAETILANAIVVAWQWMTFHCWVRAKLHQTRFISAKFSESTSHSYSFCRASAVELRYSLTSWQLFHQQQHEVYLLESSGRATAELTKL